MSDKLKSIVHEINNTLTVIYGYFQLEQIQEEKNQLHHVDIKKIQLINTCIEKCSRIIELVREISEIQKELEKKGIEID